MIGQVKLGEQVLKMLKKNYPKFIIFIGPKGSGKKTFIKEHFNGIYLESNKIDSVRKMIQIVYKVSNQTFIMQDADTMSTAARNALLKIVEECPNDNRFIMTLEDVSNTLDTIRSRASIFFMDRYTPKEIMEYAVNVYGIERADANLRSIIADLCETPGEVNTLGDYPLNFVDYVNLVRDNIDEVSISNVFKISSKIALKDDAEGYDLRMFWKAFQRSSVMLSVAKVDKDEANKYANWALITSKYLRQLRTKGVNRQMLFDNWILEIRDGR